MVSFCLAVSFRVKLRLSLELGLGSEGGTEYRKVPKTFLVVFGTENLTLTLNKNYGKQVGCFRF